MAVHSSQNAFILMGGRDLSRGGVFNSDGDLVKTSRITSGPDFSAQHAVQDFHVIDNDGAPRQSIPVGKSSASFSFGGFMTDDANEPGRFLRTLTRDAGGTGVPVTIGYQGRARGRPCIISPGAVITGEGREFPAGELQRFTGEFQVSGGWHEAFVLLGDDSDSINAANGDATSGTRTVDLNGGHTYPLSGLKPTVLGNGHFQFYTATPGAKFAVGSSVVFVGATGSATNYLYEITAVSDDGHRFDIDPQGHPRNLFSNVSAVTIVVHRSGIIAVAHIGSVRWGGATQFTLRLRSRAHNGLTDADLDTNLLTATSAANPGGFVSVAKRITPSGGVNRYVRASWTVTGHTGNFRAVAHIAFATL